MDMVSRMEYYLSYRCRWDFGCDDSFNHIHCAVWSPGILEPAENEQRVLHAADSIEPRCLRFFHFFGFIHHVFFPGNRGDSEIFIDRSLGKRPERVQREQAGPDAHDRIGPGPDWVTRRI